MSLNFFTTECKEQGRSNLEFGLCDDQKGEKAYSNAINKETWIATVQNSNGIELHFTPIDKCLINDQEYPNKGRCDGMLTSSIHLYFVELKNKKEDWLQEAIHQLESTIELYKESHPNQNFKHQKVFACNRKHKHFQEIDNEFNKRFKRKFGFRIDIQSNIVVV